MNRHHSRNALATCRDKHMQVVIPQRAGSPRPQAAPY
ncbi:hypothetical protein JMJ77_0010663 [Colletotrichum scovillei]|uniref:Uncharacterized protein n=1 Tax=Colletotrichum scovillei TaxID=1209932 RepID=A0A9P7R3S8_9PEZI|nr:hypothetical protein JMJ77_0010663 [Colletotrichum scovillei]KAG7059632.1 hypothetical protein JMJ78_0014921 [Colletotrichum scovillei]KAG7067076.1 hypothetical protein JMJ76_0008519 [Colletotrichum scovillei]